MAFILQHYLGKYVPSEIFMSHIPKNVSPLGEVLKIKIQTWCLSYANHSAIAILDG